MDAGLAALVAATKGQLDAGEVNGVLLPLELVANSQNRVGAWL